VVDHEALLAGAAPPQAPATPWRMNLEGDLEPQNLAELKAALLTALEAHQAVDLDVSRAGRMGPAFLQFVCAAHLTCRARGKELRVTGIAPAAREAIGSLGFGPDMATSCRVPSCPLNAGAHAP